MELLFWCTVWAVISYMVVKKYKEKYPELEAEPINYAIGSFLIGGLWVMLYFAFKVHEYKKYWRKNK